jgi:hypothetical protein
MWISTLEWIRFTVIDMKTKLVMAAAVVLAATPGMLMGAEPHSKDLAEEPVPTPDWARHLIVCEIPIKAYTSPQGPESGTFNSLREKIPHLEALGVSGVWLTGHSWADPKHFYNIWTQYACFDPFQLDPSLGTPEDFKALIEAFHKAGIRVFLDIITHGVMNESPLIKEHPDWFKGASWGMTDFDWNARNPALDAWWIDGCVDVVTRYGVDGFRLDLSGYRYDLWKEIRRRCAEAGHAIVIIPESPDMIEGVTDFCQNYLGVSESFYRSHVLHPLIRDLAGHILSNYGETISFRFRVKLQYADGTILHADEDTTLSVLADRSDKVGRLQEEADGIPDIHLRVTGVPPNQTPTAIRLDGGPGYQWGWPADGRFCVVKALSTSSDGVLELAASPHEVPRPDGFLGSIQLSSHDNGWEGTPPDQNPYTARGSRHLVGYAMLFAPAIPVFMAGEEFDCDYRPLPNLSPYLFGGKDPGKGRWLYGSWIDWTQLDRPEKRAMLKDVSRMIEIRKKYADVLAAEPVARDPNIAGGSVEGEHAGTLPTPYLRWNDRMGILVAANPGDKTVRVPLRVPVSKTGWTCDRIVVTDLWSGKAKRVIPVSAESRDVVLDVEMAADKTAGGGLGVFLLQPE